MEYVISKYKPMSIEFVDDEFTLNRKRAEEICDEIKRRGIDIPWACSSRVDTITRGLLKKMKESGCVTIFYGIESGSQRILNFIRKGIKIRQIIDAVKWTKKMGIEVLGSFVMGFPTETIKEIKKTIAFAKKLRVDYAQFSIATPYPGTALYQLAKKEGLLMTEDWSQYTAARPVMYLKEVTAKKLLSLLRKAYINFYLSPSFIFRQLSKGRLSFITDVIRLAIKTAFGELDALPIYGTDYNTKDKAKIQRQNFQTLENMVRITRVLDNHLIYYKLLQILNLI